MPFASENLTTVSQNPFAVQTPEDIPASTIVELFVDVFSDFFQILNVGHTFLNGPRGSGKSMMYRYMEPDCQQIALNKPLAGLPFFGVYIPIKNTELKITEFSRLTNSNAEYSLAEHLLVSFVAVKVFLSLEKAAVQDPDGSFAALLRNFYNINLRERLYWTGWTSIPALDGALTFEQVVTEFQRLFIGFYTRASAYLKRLSFTQMPMPYDGPLIGYLDFLFPLLREMKEWPFLPSGPIYLLIDDADNLDTVQTRILNGWVSSRSSSFVSLKISTQLNYKTHLTANNQTISAPHDFNEVNISAVYTTETDRYLDRVTKIVERRLANANIDKSPHQFFPVYQKQEEEIEQIAQSLYDSWPESGRGYRARDDANRYARPNYIRSLSGPSKSGSTYRYAGFTQLVHLSSGVVRYFLESASSMFGEMKSELGDGLVDHIATGVQDKVVREEAQRFFFDDFEQFEVAESESEEQVVRVRLLRNLVAALGGMFRVILLSDAAERRVFSVALSDRNDQEVLLVLRLGVQLGYFHQSSIGNKEGTGRTRLYILSRRLAPMFQLDPTSFAGYKFMTTQALRYAMTEPKSFVRRFKEAGRVDDLVDSQQINLFDEEAT